jgi:hypothetical protein
VAQDQTVEWVSHLERPAVEEKLRQIVAEAKARKLDNIIALLGHFVGMSQGKRIALCLHALSGASGQKALFAQLEVVELNLPNLS